MASVKKCDICGGLFEATFVPDITIHKYIHGYGEKRLDICPECQKKLEKFVNKEE